MFAWAALNEGGFGKCNVCISRGGLGVHLERVRLQFGHLTPPNAV